MTRPSCRVAECGRVTVARGLCRGHYDRERYERTGRQKIELKAKSAGIEIVRGRVWVDDSGLTQVVVCDECGCNFGPWIEDPANAQRFARQHRDSHRDRSADDE